MRGRHVYLFPTNASALDRNGLPSPGKRMHHSCLQSVRTAPAHAQSPRPVTLAAQFSAHRTAPVRYLCHHNRISRANALHRRHCHHGHARIGVPDIHYHRPAHHHDIRQCSRPKRPADPTKAGRQLATITHTQFSQLRATKKAGSKSAPGQSLFQLPAARSATSPPKSDTQLAHHHRKPATNHPALPSLPLAAHSRFPLKDPAPAPS